MKEKTPQQETEELVALLYPNHFLKRDLPKLHALYVAGMTKGLQMGKEILIKQKPLTS